MRKVSKYCISFRDKRVTNILPTLMVCKIYHSNIVVFHSFLKGVYNPFVLLSPLTQFYWLDIFLNKPILIKHTIGVKQFFFPSTLRIQIDDVCLNSVAIQFINGFDKQLNVILSIETTIIMVALHRETVFILMENPIFILNVIIQMAQPITSDKNPLRFMFYHLSHLILVSLIYR